MAPALQRIETLQDQDLWTRPLEAEPQIGTPRALDLDEVVFRARRLTRASREHTDGSVLELIPTGVPEVDRLLAGGLARGEVVETVGRRSSGRFSLALAFLAAATHAGEAAALVDLGDHLDPQAATALGVDLERLLWLRPSHMKQALGSAEMLLETGFPAVVLDLGQPPVPGGRGADASWVRLGRAARDHRGALLVASPYRVSGATAHAVLELCSDGSVWLGARRAARLFGAFSMRIERARARGRLRYEAPAATLARVRLRSWIAEQAVHCEPVRPDREAVPTADSEHTLPRERRSVTR